MKSKKNKKIRKPMSIQVKLFFSLCVVIVLTILFLIIINNLVLETFYIYNKKDSAKDLYEQINEKYNNNVAEEEIEELIKYQASKNNLDILITDVKRNKVITNDQTRIEALEKLKTIVEFNQNGKWGETLYNAKNIIIKTVKDNSINRNYIV